MIDIDVPHDPPGRRDFAHQRRHLSARAAPRRRKIEEHDIAGGDGSRIGAGR